jgi:hypothetical protein
VNNDTPLPPEEPQGENPPAGAILYYYLPTQTSGEVTLEVIDGSGHVVRRYSSDDRQQAARTPPSFADYWLPQPQILSAEAGMHRFNWDLRYAPAAAGGGGYSMAVANLKTEPQPQGPLVAPGGYRVKLTVAGNSYEQQLEVGPDPRVQASPELYAQQFTLAKRIYDGLQQAGEGLRQIGQTRAALKHQPNAELEHKLARVAGAARGEEDEESAAEGQPTLRHVSASLSHLLGVVESADAPVTKQASDAAEETLNQLRDLLVQLRQLQPAR